VIAAGIIVATVNHQGHGGFEIDDLFEGGGFFGGEDE
jgi:hypothetical protein